MKIDCTRKEYQRLLEMLYIADWVMNSYTKKDANSEHAKVQQSILALATDLFDGDFVDRSSNGEDYFIDSRLADSAKGRFIEPFEQAVFRDELLEQLCERDLLDEVGEIGYEKLALFERIDKLDALREKYINEFKEHGLQNLRVVYDKIEVN